MCSLVLSSPCAVNDRTWVCGDPDAVGKIGSSWLQGCSVTQPVLVRQQQACAQSGAKSVRSSWSPWLQQRSSRACAARVTGVPNSSAPRSSRLVRVVLEWSLRMEPESPAFKKVNVQTQQKNIDENLCKHTRMNTVYKSLILYSRRLTLHKILLIIVAVLQVQAVHWYWFISTSNNSVLCLDRSISKSAKEWFPLTTKRAGKRYYKGNGSMRKERLTSKRKFTLEKNW